MIFTLNGAHTDSVATITVNEATTSAATTGNLTLGTERVSYTGKGTYTFTGVTRGQFGSTAIAHAAGKTISRFYEVTSAKSFVFSYCPARITIKQSIAISTVSFKLLNLVVGSSWAIIDLDNNRKVRSSGIAETSTITTTFENFKKFNAVVNIRKQGLLPAEYPTYVDSGYTQIYVSQVVDSIA